MRLPVMGTALTQGPNFGPVGRDWSPIAGSRAKSLRLYRAEVALGSSGSLGKLKRIEGGTISVWDTLARCRKAHGR
jgi:hypothetical protein